MSLPSRVHWEKRQGANLEHLRAMMSQNYTPPKLVPPFRFATVEVGVYRGAYPTLKVPPAACSAGQRRRARAEPRPVPARTPLLMPPPHAPQNFPFLETRKIRTIISLIPEKPTQV